jgi:hypothetical protein
MSQCTTVMCVFLAAFVRFLVSDLSFARCHGAPRGFNLASRQKKEGGAAWVKGRWLMHVPDGLWLDPSRDLSLTSGQLPRLPLSRECLTKFMVSAQICSHTRQALHWPSSSRLIIPMMLSTMSPHPRHRSAINVIDCLASAALHYSDNSPRPRPATS